ncbi:hypothetical protein NC652_012381 [Populus alba x Populus x berolinensis]|nr:hypothetical protein NC652_012381 [Populus alba x Populus x berolinensis]
MRLDLVIGWRLAFSANAGFHYVGSLRKNHNFTDKRTTYIELDLHLWITLSPHISIIPASPTDGQILEAKSSFEEALWIVANPTVTSDSTKIIASF